MNIETVIERNKKLKKIIQNTRVLSDQEQDECSLPFFIYFTHYMTLNNGQSNIQHNLASFSSITVKKGSKI